MAEERGGDPQMTVRVSGFHARSTQLNGANEWTMRNGFSLAKHYGDPRDEAIAARFSAVMSDISWRWRVVLEGAQSPQCLSRIVTRDARALEVGRAFKALWLNDAGAVRGAGAIARLGPDSFLLASTVEDREWIGAAARLFGVQMIEQIESHSGLAIVGPYAAGVIRTAGLDSEREVLSIATLAWNGIEINLSRLGEHGGFEIWCRSADAPTVWDRIARAGQAFSIVPAGVEAFDILDMEAGLPRPGRDYCVSQDGFGAEPRPGELGLSDFIDTGHTEFNGHAALVSATGREKRSLVGVSIDGGIVVPFAALARDGRPVGHTLSSAYSPSLRRALAFAIIEAEHAGPGTALTVTIAERPPAFGSRTVAAHVTNLPFFGRPGQMGA